MCLIAMAASRAKTFSSTFRPANIFMLRAWLQLFRVDPRSGRRPREDGNCRSLGFLSASARRQARQVQALVDGSDDNTANVLIGYSQAVVQGYSAEVQIDWLRERGLSIQPAAMSVNTRTWYNEDLESSAFIIPGVLAL